MQQVTVIGGGLAGLIAASEAAERGASVRLLEAWSRLGGRATTLPGPYKANLGPHALYAGTSLWDWLSARALERPSAAPAARGPVPLAGRDPAHAACWCWRRRSGKLRGRTAPVDQPFRDWVAEHCR